ncbi:hypothetical protein UFOVP27_129 [uncultured Caudovirales phage]|uniref:Uncharacterized protein n=1 Tax=uncultured Caudovirales phage TaxID=2100421 RepID=A0A6J5KJH1_9CAUD|nr:hypothetical protein UFOVP27_129 [uncultured Caudovirales phage]
MGSKKKAEPVSAEAQKSQGLRILASESPFVWNQYRYGHDWDCPKCGEKVFHSNNKGRLRLSQFAAENDIKGIGNKAQMHLASGCSSTEAKLPHRKDLDGPLDDD